MVVAVLGSSCPTSLLTGESIFSWGKGVRGSPVANAWPPSPPSARGSRTAVGDFLQLLRLVFPWIVVPTTEQSVCVWGSRGVT